MVYYTLTPRRFPTKPHVLRFCMVQCSQSPVCRHGGVRHTHVQPRKRRLWGYYTLTPRSVPTKPHVLRFCMVQCSQSPMRRHRGVCHTHVQPRKRRLWGYYTLTPRSGPNKTACAAVLHGSMFSKPCAPAQGRVPCTRAAAQAAALGLLYPDAAKTKAPSPGGERGGSVQRTVVTRREMSSFSLGSGSSLIEPKGHLRHQSVAIR